MRLFFKILIICFALSLAILSYLALTDIYKSSSNTIEAILIVKVFSYSIIMSMILTLIIFYTIKSKGILLIILFLFGILYSTQKQIECPIFGCYDGKTHIEDPYCKGKGYFVKSKKIVSCFNCNRQRKIQIKCSTCNGKGKITLWKKYKNQITCK